MDIYDATNRVADVLMSLKTDYLVVGSIASSYYGIPRSTTDADFVVEFRQGLIVELANALGSAFRLDLQMQLEIFSGKRFYKFEVIGTVFHVDVFDLQTTAYDQERFQRRRPVPLGERMIYLPTPEDVLIMKLRWQRSKDLEDARAVMAVQRPNLDWEYLERWCEHFGAAPLLAQLRDETAKF